ncbi:MAG: hypothetical protein MK077_07960 [Phycisphaerales bacterium]|nr:hypothetical protein [Phycisphaerales bacterium]
MYKHRQVGYLIRIVFIISTLILLTNIFFTRQLAPPFVEYLMYGSILILLMCGWIFGSLTVTVDEDEIKHWFGPGFWRKTYQMSNVVSAKPVVNKWWWGWGIRLTPHGWLYNVSGLDAVELELASGKRVRVGTDEPEEFSEAVKSYLN